MSKNKKNTLQKTILLIGGGTGGHILPLKNLAKSLLKKGQKVHLIVSNSPLDKKIIQNDFSGIILKNKKNFKIHYLKAHKLHYHFSTKNFLNIFKIPLSFFTARKLIKKINPDILFFKGGFVGLPILIASQYLMKFKGKIYLHESDISSGALTNFFGKYADRIFSNFGKSPKPLFFFPITKKGGTDKKGNHKEFPLQKKFSKNPKKILIFGGSQGAQFLNKIILENAEKLLKKNFHITLVTGILNKSHTNNLLKKYKLKSFKNLEIFNLLPQDDLIKKIINSDLIITRSGASIFQIFAAHKKSILIPLPTSARNHQQHNADYFKKKKICYILKQNKQTASKLVSEIQKILKDKTLEKNLKTINIQDASEKITEIILK